MKSLLERIILFHLYLFVTAEIKIQNLNIPEGVEHDKTTEIILDCDYTFQKTDINGLVVKWFFPHIKNVIYQWIPTESGISKPLIKHQFESIIDHNYKASDDPLTMYRALKINKVTPEITGNYTCSVSSYSSEDTKGKRLVVYRKADKVEFIHLEQSDMYICAAYGIFPKPVLNIYVKGSNLTKIEDGDDNEENNPESNEEDEDTVDVANGVYNVTSSFKYLRSEIKEQTQFICELWIPDTDYHVTYNSIVFPENAGVIHRLSGYLLPILIIAMINYS